MKFSKQEKGFVVRWIDRQFSKNPTFPASCINGDKSKPEVSKGHLKAYKAWTNTGTKKSEIAQWIDEWLNKSEIKDLEAYIARKVREKEE